MTIHSNDAFAPVAFLKLKSIALKDKKVSVDNDVDYLQL